MSRKVYRWNGRVDGIGNRLEEVIWLEGIACVFGVEINYHWRTQGSAANRNYPMQFKCRYITIQNHTHHPGHRDPVHEEYNWYAHRSRETMAKYASGITPTFDIAFVDDVHPVGIHIRSTDRIRPGAKKDYQTPQQFKYAFEKTIQILNTTKPKHVFIASDDSKKRAEMIARLDPAISILKPVTSNSNEKISPEWIDFFALSLCSEIIMCCKFSSFSACASLVGGGVPLKTFFGEHTSNLWRFYTNYHLIQLSPDQ